MSDKARDTDAVILGAARTPVSNFGGAYHEFGDQGGALVLENLEAA